MLAIRHVLAGRKTPGADSGTVVDEAETISDETTLAEEAADEAISTDVTPKGSAEEATEAESDPEQDEGA